MFRGQSAAGSMTVIFLAASLLAFATPGQAGMSRAELLGCIDSIDSLKEQERSLKSRFRELDHEDRRLENEHDQISGLSRMNVELAESNYRQCRQWQPAAACNDLAVRARELERQHNQRVRRYNQDNTRLDRAFAEAEREDERLLARWRELERECSERSIDVKTVEEVCTGPRARNEFCQSLLR